MFQVNQQLLWLLNACNADFRNIDPQPFYIVGRFAKNTQVTESDFGLVLIYITF